MNRNFQKKFLEKNPALKQFCNDKGELIDGNVISILGSLRKRAFNRDNFNQIKLPDIPELDDFRDAKCKIPNMRPSEVFSLVIFCMNEENTNDNKAIGKSENISNYFTGYPKRMDDIAKFIVASAEKFVEHNNRVPSKDDVWGVINNDPPKIFYIKRDKDDILCIEGQRLPRSIFEKRWKRYTKNKVPNSGQ